MDKEEFMDSLESDVNELDLSRDEDLSIGLMNLISLEEHLFFTHEKTDSDQSLEILSEIRKIRTEAMQELVNDTEGEEWCISKHLLAAAMRFRETGDKMLDRDREKAEMFYDRAFSLYSMFWAVNFNLEDNEKTVEKAKKISHEGGSESTKGTEESIEIDRENQDKNSWLDGVKDTVKKAVDCCKEL